jgi:uncharacterized protein (TIGR03067 family)
VGTALVVTAPVRLHQGPGHNCGGNRCQFIFAYIFLAQNELTPISYMARYPNKGSELKRMRWRFVRDKLKVEWILDQDGKQSRAPVAEFPCRLDARDKPWIIDRTWQPPGFEGLVRDEKGQVVLGIYQKEGDRLEVVLNHTGKARPSAFKADRSRCRLIFREVSH